MYWHNFSLSRYIFRFIQQFFFNSVIPMINTCIDFSCSEISSITGYFGKKLATGLKSFGENSNNFSTVQICH